VLQNRGTIISDWAMQIEGEDGRRTQRVLSFTDHARPRRKGGSTLPLGRGPCRHVVALCRCISLRGHHGCPRPTVQSGITKVAGIEARSFILGAAVARELETGFVAIRKDTGLFPGPKLTRVTANDYRANSSLLRLQRASLSPGDRVLLVDDWIETGSQAAAAHALIEEAGAEFVGVSVIVDQFPRDSTPMLGKFAAVIRAEALGSSAY
jgi:adenine phosphoribosyltransferase